jgi:hypothetical protein
MNPATNTMPRPLPRWVVVAASCLIVFHFLALGAVVLAAPSGPWPTNFGSSPAPGPRFAEVVSRFTTRNYLRPLHMSNDYHFVSNVTGMPSIFFEVNLKDQTGKVFKTLKFPDEKANPLVRHRQRLLAEGLGNDLPVQQPPGEQVLPPGKSYPTVQVWLNTAGDPAMRLQEVSILKLPRDRQVARPADWAVLLAHAYCRYLCREHGAASAEIVRHSRNALMPDILFVGDAIPREAFTEQVCIFGDYRP